MVEASRFVYSFWTTVRIGLSDVNVEVKRHAIDVDCVSDVVEIAAGKDRVTRTAIV